jgi:hypothetical protein
VHGTELALVGSIMRTPPDLHPTAAGLRVLLIDDGAHRVQLIQQEMALQGSGAGEVQTVAYAQVNCAPATA